MRVGFDQLDQPHIDIDQPTLPGMYPYEIYVCLDDAVILEGSLAIAGWRYGERKGELFGDNGGYDVVPHNEGFTEIEVEVDGLSTPRFSSEEDVLRNLIKTALSAKDAA